MSKRLSDNLNSGYIGAASQLRSHGARQRIVAYVESFDDIFFWRNVLSRLEDNRIYFEVMLPSRTSLAKGKKIALTNILSGKLGSNMIACVDADYDYLLQGANDTSRTVCTNPYVFHTFAYSIENLQCYAPSLHSVCVMATLNDRKAFDFEQFLTEFSKTVYPLFVWSIWCYRSGNYKRFSMADMCAVFAMADVNLFHPERAIAIVRRKVNRTVSTLQRTFPQAKDTYRTLKDELRTLGVTPENTYMYMRGHDIFDNVVCPLLTNVCEVLRREREREIKRLAISDVQLQNELAGYQHCVAPAGFTLRKQTGFYDAPQYRQIIESLEKFTAKLKNGNAQPEQPSPTGKNTDSRI